MFESFVNVQRTITPAATVSDKYVHVNTGAMIDALADLGFEVHSVRTNDRSRDAMRAKHEVDMRLPSSNVLDDGSVPRLLILNSHNGSSKAKFLCGLFRFVCSNGLTVGTTWGNESVRHAGNMAREVIERARTAASQTARTLETAAEWQRKLLTQRQQIEMAQQALVLRFGDRASGYTPESLIQARRQDDVGDDLWRVYNRIQESGMVGGLRGVSEKGRRTTARKLTAIEARLAWNQQLWDLAERTAEVV